MTTSTNTPDYNGWHNRATWNVALWASNDEAADAAITAENKVLAAAGKRWNRARAIRVLGSVFGDRTPDGIKIDSRLIAWREVLAMLNEGVAYWRNND